MKKPAARDVIQGIPVGGDPDDPIVIIAVDPSTGKTVITIPALHSQTGKPTVITVDPEVTEAAIMAIVKAILGG